MFPKGLWY